MIELVRQYAFKADDVISIEADVTQITFDFTGGGLYGSDREKITTKEQARPQPSLPARRRAARRRRHARPIPPRPDQPRRCPTAPG
jgi:2-methylcitrate dehydratase